MAIDMGDRVYCSYFDHNYLSRGVALYRSLQRHAPAARLWVLCLSEQCHTVLTAMKLPGVIAVRLADFEAADPEVAATRATRSTIEYYFTCTPAWMRYVMGREADAEWVTYLDGDLYFFASPEPIYDELRDASVAIIPHRYAPDIGRLQRFGTYNVAWVGARNDADAEDVIGWWRARCIEWCHDYVDGDRFADQGYLDGFAARSPRVRAIENIGANLAPWNIGNYRLSLRDGAVMLDDSRPLVFFHFQGLRKGLRWFFFTSHRVYHAPFCAVARNRIYKPHIQELLDIERDVDPLLPISAATPHRRAAVGNLRQFVAGLLRNLRTRAFQVLDIMSGRAFLIFRGRAL
jgi:hypothetical protein